jgi:hypothetical protein
MAPRRWTAPWVDELTDEQRAELEALPIYDDELCEGEGEATFVPPSLPDPKPAK